MLCSRSSFVTFFFFQIFKINFYLFFTKIAVLSLLFYLGIQLILVNICVWVFVCFFLLFKLGGNYNVVLVSAVQQWKKIFKDWVGPTSCSFSTHLTFPFLALHKKLSLTTYWATLSFADKGKTIQTNWSKNWEMTSVARKGVGYDSRMAEQTHSSHQGLKTWTWGLHIARLFFLLISRLCLFLLGFFFCYYRW